MRMVWVFFMSSVKTGYCISMRLRLLSFLFPLLQSGEQAPQADAHRAQIGDLVNFQLGV